MDRALYSIEETRARLGGISRNSLYAMLRAGELPSVVLGCRRFVSAEAIAALIRISTTSVSPSQDAVRSRRPLVNAGHLLPSSARVTTGSRKSDAE
jgi:helix-turn-helix protein